MRNQSLTENIKYHDDLIIEEKIPGLLNLKPSLPTRKISTNEDELMMSQRLASQSQKTSSHTKKTTGSSDKVRKQFDYQRMEILYQVLQSTGRAEDIIRTFQILMESIRDIVYCQSGTIFLFEDVLNEKEMKALNIQKTIVDGHFIDVIVEQG